MKTLKEVCNICKVSRRTVQGYEKMKLISISSKNKMGHNLYDEKTIEDIKKIKLFREFGFSLKEIQNLSNLDCMELKGMLIEKEKRLKEQSVSIECALHEIRQWLESL